MKELFGWRRNRREVGGCLGLVPSPYASGQSETEQGISKAGNRRVRALMVELAWCWLRYQPQEATHPDLESQVRDRLREKWTTTKSRFKFTKGSSTNDLIEADLRKLL